MALGALTTSLQSGATLKYGTTTHNFLFKVTSPDNTKIQAGRFQIAKGEADTAVDFGSLASADAFIIIASENLDNVFTSTVVGAAKVAMGQKVIAMTGLNSITTIHIDCTGSAAIVEIVYMLVSNE